MPGVKDKCVLFKKIVCKHFLLHGRLGLSADPVKGTAVFANEVPPGDERGRPAAAPQPLPSLGSLGVGRPRRPLLTTILLGGSLKLCHPEAVGHELGATISQKESKSRTYLAGGAGGHAQGCLSAWSYPPHTHTHTLPLSPLS